MDYEVIPREGGEPIKSTADVRALYASDASRRSLGEDRGPEVLWRMANQSLFAEVAQAVHTDVLAPHDYGGTLCLAATTQRASFRIDLSRNALRSTCDLSLGTLSGETASQRLGLATATIAVEAEVSGDGSCCHRFAQDVEALQPATVFDEQLVAAAGAIAELGPEEDSLEAFLDDLACDRSASRLSGCEAAGDETPDRFGVATVRAARRLGTATGLLLGTAASASASAFEAARGILGQGLSSVSRKDDGDVVGHDDDNVRSRDEWLESALPARGGRCCESDRSPAGIGMSVHELRTSSG